MDEDIRDDCSIFEDDDDEDKDGPIISFNQNIFESGSEQTVNPMRIRLRNCGPKKNPDKEGESSNSNDHQKENTNKNDLNNSATTSSTQNKINDNPNISNIVAAPNNTILNNQNERIGQLNNNNNNSQNFNNQGNSTNSQRNNERINNNAEPSPSTSQLFTFGNHSFNLNLNEPNKNPKTNTNSSMRNENRQIHSGNQHNNNNQHHHQPYFTPTPVVRTNTVMQQRSIEEDTKVLAEPLSVPLRVNVGVNVVQHHRPERVSKPSEPYVPPPRPAGENILQHHRPERVSRSSESIVPPPRLAPLVNGVQNPGLENDVKVLADPHDPSGLPRVNVLQNRPTVLPRPPNVVQRPFVVPRPPNFVENRPFGPNVVPPPPNVVQNRPSGSTVEPRPPNVVQNRPFVVPRPPNFVENRPFGPNVVPPPPNVVQNKPSGPTVVPRPLNVVQNRPFVVPRPPNFVENRPFGPNVVPPPPNVVQNKPSGPTEAPSINIQNCQNHCTERENIIFGPVEPNLIPRQTVGNVQNCPEKDKEIPRPEQNQGPEEDNKESDLLLAQITRRMEELHGETPSLVDFSSTKKQCNFDNDVVIFKNIFQQMISQFQKQYSELDALPKEKRQEMFSKINNTMYTAQEGYSKMMNHCKKVNLHWAQKKEVFKPENMCFEERGKLFFVIIYFKALAKDPRFESESFKINYTGFKASQLLHAILKKNNLKLETHLHNFKKMTTIVIKEYYDEGNKTVIELRKNLLGLIEEGCTALKNMAKSNAYDIEAILKEFSECGYKNLALEAEEIIRRKIPYDEESQHKSDLEKIFKFFA